MKDNILKYIGLLSLLIFGGYVLGRVLPHQLTTEDCLKLGSNYRTDKCLEEIGQPTPTPTYFGEIDMLSISDQSMTGNTYYEPNPTYQATLTNNSARIAKDIVMRFRFYKGDSTKCDDNQVDTEYINVLDTILPADSKRIRTVVKTNADTYNRFRWCADIVSAHEWSN